MKTHYLFTLVAGLMFSYLPASTFADDVASEQLFADRFVTKSDAAPNSPEETIFLALESAQARDFEAYLSLIHPDERITETQIWNRKRYEWQRFMNQYEWYTARVGDQIGFYIVKVDEFDATHRRVFLRDQIHEGRMPTPIRFKKAGERWYIESNSLLN